MLDALPIAVKLLFSTFAQSCILPFCNVVSFATIGIFILSPVFVEFHEFSTAFPPVETIVPTVKSAGDVLSKVTLLLSVVLITFDPSLPAESENAISKTTKPSGSLSVKV